MTTQSITRIVVYGYGGDVVLDKYLSHAVTLEPGDLLELEMGKPIKARHIRKIQKLQEQLGRVRDQLANTREENRELKRRLNA